MIHAAMAGLTGAGETPRLAGARLAPGERLCIDACLERQKSLGFRRGAADFRQFQSDNRSTRAQDLAAVLQEADAGVRAANRLAGAVP